MVCLSAFSYFGPKRVKLLIGYFGSAKKVWQARISDLSGVGLKSKATEFDKFRNNFDVDRYFKKLKKFEVKILTLSDNEYPKNLKETEDAPHVLYVRGEITPTDSSAVAIVGTRMMTSYGREVTEKVASEFAEFGVTIVSGLALGVDAAAQKAALKAGGRTIAVLASGLDIISPYSNKFLGEEILKGNGAIVSEQPLGHLPFKQDFAVRNRLISGLSKAVVVVEGRMKSGTFYTVNAANEQGRPVFAVPGPVTSPASEGPNFLIQNGAKMVVSARDVMEELDIQIKVDSTEVSRLMPEDKKEEKIYKILETEPLHLDELARILGLPTAEVSARLTIMEIKGTVKSLGKGVYKKI